MVYNPYTWQDGSAGNTAIIAARLNALEAGVGAAHSAPVKGTKMVTDYGTLQTITANSTAQQIADALTNNNAIFLAAVRDQPDLMAVGPEAFVPVSLSFNNEPVRLRANLIHVRGDAANGRAAAPAISVINPFGAAQAVTVGTVTIGPASGINQETTNTLILPAGGNYAKYSQGAVGMIYCNDYFPWSSQALNNNNIYRAENTTVAGILLNVDNVSLTAAGNPATLERHSIRGVSSNVTALVNGWVNNGDGTAKIILPSISANFTAGENIIDVPSGAVIGKATTTNTMNVLLFSRLDFTYLDNKNPQFRLMDPNNTCDLDISLKTNVDPETFINSTDRGGTLGAITLAGVFYPRVRVKALNAFTRVVLLRSCHMGTVEATVRGVSNHALSPSETYAEQAYGYGVECRGTTYGTMIRVIGDNLRHLFTTNPNGKTYEVDNNAHLDYGCGAHYITVHDSVATNTYSASFDTHEGCYKVKFVNCRAIRNLSAGRQVTVSQGFNNRGFGTTYENCHTDGTASGFSSGGEALSAGFKHTISWINCTSSNYQSNGFTTSPSVSGLAQDGTTNLGVYATLRYENCSAQGDGSVTTGNYYQTGFKFQYGVFETFNMVSTCFNGAPFEVNGDGSIHMWYAPRADYRDSPTGTQTGVRLVGTMGSFTISGKLRITSKTPTNPNCAFRNISGNTIVVYDGIAYNSAADTTTARAATIAVSLISGGSPTFTDTSASSGGGSSTPVHTGTPTGVLATGAGTGAAGAGPSGSIFAANSQDVAGAITVTAGTSPAAGLFVTVTYGSAFTSYAFPVIIAGNGGANTKNIYVSSYSLTGFTISFGGAPTAGASTIVMYNVTGV